MISVNVTNATEYEIHRWVTEASALGLRPGHWPERLPTSLGNGQDFVLPSVETEYNGDVIAMVYRQDCGNLVLRVYND